MINLVGSQCTNPDSYSVATVALSFSVSSGSAVTLAPSIAGRRFNGRLSIASINDAIEYDDLFKTIQTEKIVRARLRRIKASS